MRVGSILVDESGNWTHNLQISTPMLFQLHPDQLYSSMPGLNLNDFSIFPDAYYSLEETVSVQDKIEALESTILQHIRMTYMTSNQLIDEVLKDEIIASNQVYRFLNFWTCRADCSVEPLSHNAKLWDLNAISSYSRSIYIVTCQRGGVSIKSPRSTPAEKLKTACGPLHSWYSKYQQSEVNNQLWGYFPTTYTSVTSVLWKIAKSPNKLSDI